MDIRGKNILEVGGAVPIDLIRESGVSTWTAVDISPGILEKGQGNSKDERLFRPKNLDIADFDEENAYDVVYSTNCFEHILRLEEALERIYKALKSDGILFSIFAPIWTSPDGHHAWIKTDQGLVRFDGNIVPPWYHLVKDEATLHEIVSEKYSPDVADEFCRIVFRAPSINRRIDSQYENCIAGFPYSSIAKFRIPTLRSPKGTISSELRIKHPEVRSFSTMGYLWVLKKGSPTIREYLRFYSLGIFELIRRKLK